MGTNEAPLSASCSAGTLTLHCAGGSLETSLDAFGSVSRTVPGDFVFTAHLTHLELKGNEAEPMAGLFLQQDYQPGSPRAAYLVDSAENLWRFTRTRTGTAVTVTKDKLNLPIWLRLVRDGHSVRCYSSTDGYNWELQDLLGMRMPESAQVGFVACTPDLDSPASAAFDRIRLTLGPPPMESVDKGILLTDGTFLAEPLIELSSLELTEEHVSVRMAGRPAPLTFASDQLARILYQPLATEDAEHFAGKTGVLLRNKDFSEGAMHSVRQGEITVESILLGRHVYRS